MKLTQEQKRIKIAQAQGFKFSPTGRSTECPFWGQPVPDYFNDLNACHEAKKKLTKEQCPVFHDYLMDTEKPSLHVCINNEHPWSERWSWGQPPETEAECLGLALKLWEVGQ